MEPTTLNKKLKREKPNKKWTADEIKTVLDYLEKSENIEKFMEKSGIDATWDIKRWKVRYLKASYKKANDWRSSTNAAIIFYFALLRGILKQFHKLIKHLFLLHMPLPQLSKQITKIISLTFFGITTIIKLVCILIINAHKDTPCIAGWHVNEEIADHLILISMTLIPDILMLVCIGVGMVFETSNIGADPGTIVYNFIVGLLTICSLLPFFGIEDCRSDNLKNIKSVGIYATMAGVLHIANGVVCLLFLAPEERYEVETEALNSTPKSSENSEEKPSTSKASSTSK